MSARTTAQVGRSSRTKGQGGEREAAKLLTELLGVPVTRRVRNRAGESDLVGVPGWSVEVKRHRRITYGLIRTWWAQAEQQAKLEGLRPLLLLRGDGEQWRCFWFDRYLLCASPEGWAYWCELIRGPDRE